jgi:hypothetical protein
MNDSQDWIVLLTPRFNVTFPDIETLYTSFGFARIVSLLYVTLQVATLSIGVILNAISLYLLSGKSFKIPLYFYLRVAVLDSLLACLLAIGFSLCMSRQFVNFANTSGAMKYIAYISQPIANTLIYFKFVMDAILALDRIATFKPQVKRFFKFSPYTITTLAFMISVLLVSPQYYVYTPNHYTVFSNKTGFSVVHFAETTNFTKSLIGKIIQNGVAILRNVAICALDIALNIISITLFNRHMNKKNEMVTNTGTRSRERADRNAMKMVIFICVVSVFHQIVLITNFFYVVFVGSVTFWTSITLFASTEISSLRYASNFFIFYFFNRNFRHKFKSMCGKI